MANVQRGARAGAAAVALGLSLVWPSVAIASADSPDQDSSSVSAGPAKPSTGTAHSARTAKPAHDSASKTATSGSTGKSTSAARVPANTSVDESAATSVQPKARSNRSVTDTTTAGTSGTTDTSADTQTAESQPAVSTTQKVTQAAATPAAATTTAQITALRLPTASASPTDVITGLIGSIQGLFEGVALLVRRTFFNEAPTVAPIQLTGQTVAPIDGTIDATDPEGDNLVYEVTQAPHYGTIDLNAATGTYTYTPNSSFKGVDSFVVAATDTGPHINLLNWFRSPSTSAAGAVYLEPAGTPKITYTFTYGNGSQLWSSAARAELAATAVYLSSYFKPQHDVNVTYDVTGQFSLGGSTLASAGSDLTSGADGFFPTVVQDKILTGVDANGAAADGTIDWNFGYSWGYFATVPAGSYDFQSTAMHELMHTYGFLSVVDSAGKNTVPNWTTFDSFITNSSGTKVISSGGVFDIGYNSNLTGGNGGLYFGGPTAVAAYGGPVPLYTPNPWESGSSMSHLDDNTFTGSMEKLMNAASGTGLGVRTLSTVEIAIMADLGYTMMSQSPGVAVLFIGLMLVRRRRRQ